MDVLSQSSIMQSYCPNREDVLLWRIFHNSGGGFYVDVGANHPRDGSLTNWFYQNGWSGINIEPGSIFAELSEERSRDINLNLAVSDEPGTIEFFEHEDLPATSTLRKEPGDNVSRLIAKRNCKLVETDTLSNILSRHRPDGAIDFMSIDVEGWELQVIAGNDWTRFRPSVLVIESTEPFTNLLCHHVWEPQILSADYVFGFFDGINRYYVAKEKDEFLERLSHPVNCLDQYIPFEALGTALDAQNWKTSYMELKHEYEKLTEENRRIHANLAEQISSPERLGIRVLIRGLARAVGERLNLKGRPEGS